MNNETFFFIGLTTGLLLSISIWLINKFRSYLLRKRTSLLNNRVLAQFYLSDISDYWEGEPSKVIDLPDFIERYFLYISKGYGFISKSEFYTDNEEIKQQLEGKFNHHVLIGNVRVSTFVTFSDGENILIYDRDNPNTKQGLLNSNKDCFGAVAFNNLSLLLKLPKDFWDEEILSVNLIPGVAFEYMEGGDTAIMIGISIIVGKDSLKKAVNESNSIYKLEDVDKQVDAMTSKLRLTISQK